MNNLIELFASQCEKAFRDQERLFEPETIDRDLDRVQDQHLDRDLDQDKAWQKAFIDQERLFEPETIDRDWD